MNCVHLALRTRKLVCGSLYAPCTCKFSFISYFQAKVLKTKQNKNCTKLLLREQRKKKESTRWQCRLRCVRIHNISSGFLDNYVQYAGYRFNTATGLLYYDYMKVKHERVTRETTRLTPHKRGRTHRKTKTHAKLKLQSNFAHVYGNR